MLGLFLAFGILSGAGEDVPAEYSELVIASGNPPLYRLAAVLDVLVWAGIGCVLIAFSGLFMRHAPHRALFMLGCAAGQIAGILGGFLRLEAVSELAGRYAAAVPGQREALIETYVLVERVILAHFAAGAILYGVGFLLVASAAHHLVGFPGWLRVWLALSGATILLLNAVDYAGFRPPELIWLGYLVVGVMALNFGIALAFWRGVPRSSTKATGGGVT
jgi:hypothetical protein